MTQMRMKMMFDFTVLVLLLGAIFWLSNKEHLPMPTLFEYQDKVQHFIAYFVMGGLVWRAFSHFSYSKHILFWLALGFCSLYGISDEIHQSFVPGRESSVWDWLADNLGIITALLVLYWIPVQKNDV